LLADLVRRRVAVIATLGTNTISVSAKAATATIPIVFGVADDPVALGLVASLPRPGGNATGINFQNNEAVSKRLGLFHELVPEAARVAVVVNPSNSAGTETTLREVERASPLLGLPLDILKASSSRDIEEAFTAMARAGTKALFIMGDGYFASRLAQFSMLGADHSIATSYAARSLPDAGGFMSYGTDFPDMFRQVGVYTGQILRGTRPADLPVVQPTKFEFIINLRTAKALGLTIPETLLATADEVID
jgi:putative ABC transport system substrate-binding protein